MKIITKEAIGKFKEYLTDEEKSKNTIEKYIRDLKKFSLWVGELDIDKQVVITYKAELTNNAYAPASVNSILSSLNAFFEYMEWFDCKVKMLKIQKPIFVNSEKELTKAEYERLLIVAGRKRNKLLYFLMQTICSTGIRVSELKFVTVSAIESGQAVINCKGKIRIVILPEELCKMLKQYVKQCKIKNGSIFVSRRGRALDRSNIWKMMKNLCETAKVAKEKVFPHNLRHLFARTYYSMQKDVVRLADILGHSSVNTTRIYTIETGEVHRRQLQKLGLLRC